MQNIFLLAILIKRSGGSPFSSRAPYKCKLNIARSNDFSQRRDCVPAEPLGVPRLGYRDVSLAILWSQCWQRDRRISHAQVNK